MLVIVCVLAANFFVDSNFQLDKTHDRRGARLCAPTDVTHAIENCYEAV
ncbi:hypothetical protein [Scytonema millei]|uniref:Uncharacterized protein n=1 Tax=Scytonema millei VB511283 TaxID=1245923 RepID=A0A9X5I2P1_9CYAN|nr:hypothetical protein [Scytonema millei]NHC33285.1 hypothetical protein [Scytonema millei VB511283]